MTDGTSEIASQAQGISQSEAEKPQIAPVVKQERTFGQDELNKIVGTAKLEAYQQAKRDVLNELQTQQAAQMAAQQAMHQQQPQQGLPPQQMPMQQQQMVQPPQGMQQPVAPQWQSPQLQQQMQPGMQPQQMQPGMGGMPQQQMPMQQPQQNQYLTQDSARALMAQELENQRKLAVGNQIANDFMSKLKTGSQKYPDFDEKVAPLLREFHGGKLLPLILMGNAADNTADVIYDLANNTHKIGAIMSTYKEAPELAQQEVARLSHSIKMNEQAALQNQQSPKQPLGQLKPSTSGADSGSVSVKDFKSRLKV